MCFRFWFCGYTKIETNDYYFYFGFKLNERGIFVIEVIKPYLVVIINHIFKNKSLCCKRHHFAFM